MRDRSVLSGTRPRSFAIGPFAIVIAASFVAPAAARAGQERVSGSFTAVAAPFPAGGLPVAPPVDPPESEIGCLAGIEMVHKVSHVIEAPYSGLFTVEMNGFVGDWDAGITTTPDGNALAYSAAVQIPDGAAAIEKTTVLVEAGEEVAAVACNFAGAPQAEATYDLEPFSPRWIVETVKMVGHNPETGRYVPDEVRVRVGQAVAWESPDGYSHLVVSDDGDVDSGQILDGTFAWRFTKPGRYTYHCPLHGGPEGVGMAGTVVVTR